MRRLQFWGSLAGLLSASCAGEAAVQKQPVSTAAPRPIEVVNVPGTAITNACPSLPKTRIRNLNCSDAAALIEKLKGAQAKLETGEQLYFDLFSGAKASDAMAKVSPRDAFMRIPFETAFIIERTKADNLSQTYKLAYRPASAGKVWDIEVVLGFDDKRLLRVQMLYAVPPPF